MTDTVPTKRKPGRPPKENLLEGLENLDKPKSKSGWSSRTFQETPNGEKPEIKLTTAQLVFFTGYSGEQLSDLKSQGVITPLGVSEWAGLATISTLLKRLKARKEDSGTAKDKARRIKADAHTAELKALSTGKETVLLSHAKQFWTDNRIAVRRTIERAEYISKEDREKLLREIASMKPIHLQEAVMFSADDEASMEDNDE